MAVHKGSEGAIKIGSNTIAEVKSYSLDESADTIETTSMGDAARTHVSSLTTFSGSVDAMWDETDTNGQVALAVGSTVTLLWYPEGSDSGDTYYSGSVIVTGKTITGSFDGLVEASISVQGSGAITTATV
jgi:predicted secreted protein|tara:strand:+ start:9275 stop:9664 length:390 start_codon:yes stop_codon:yes gene_type:complete